MGVYDLYSKRQKQLRGEATDVYIYDFLPDELRVQMMFIMRDVIGNPSMPASSQIYAAIVNILTREYGVFSLTDTRLVEHAQLKSFLRDEDNIERVFDALELIMRYGEEIVHKDLNIEYNYGIEVNFKSIVEELNIRFREHGVGYEYSFGKIIRIDSLLVHTEAIKPTLALLYNPMYQGANDEFLSAFEHYRHNNQKEALVNAMKAVESVMKAICKKRGWSYAPTDTASKLLATIFSNNLIPVFMQTHFNSLKSLLESGVPTVRNKLGGHGQGEIVVVVPDYFVSFALNSAASAILLLGKADAETP